jgi:hypothetical protein
MEHRFFSRLFWKISAIFILILVIFTAIALNISIKAARNYAIELNQKLNHDLAKNTVDEIKPQFRNGTINQEALNDIMHSMMVINPSVEVYLLDQNGKILSYVAPEKVVKLKRVSLDPVDKFLHEHGNKIIFGDDPRNPGEKKIFSVCTLFMACEKNTDNGPQPLDPDTAGDVSVDRFSAPAAHLFVRNADNGFPGPNEAINFDIRHLLLRASDQTVNIRSIIILTS